MDDRRTVPSRKRIYTILFIPGDQGRTISLHINRSLLRIIAGTLILFGACLVFLITYTGLIGAKLQTTRALLKDNERLAQENARLVTVQEQLAAVDRFSRYLLRLTRMSDDTTAPAFVNLVRALEAARLSPEKAKEHLTDNPAARLSRPWPESVPEDVAVILLVQPVEGWITRPYVPDSSDGEESHNGVDYAAAHGDPIRAASEGMVDEIKNDKYFGQIVTLRHDDDFTTRYGHCSQILVKVGEKVKAGQTIALVGNTGRSSGPHLHFMLERSGQPLDPSYYLIGAEEQDRPMTSP